MTYNVGDVLVCRERFGSFMVQPVNRIIEILMQRDGNTRNEAIDRINEVKDMMEDCGYDPEKSETIFMEQLGLGSYYLIDMFLEILKRKWFDE